MPTPAPPPWEKTWTTSQPYITSAQASMQLHSHTNLPVQRINILEASVLDTEIFNLLEMSFATVLGGARAMEQSAGPTSTWRRLVGLGIRLAVTGATILSNVPTPGQVLQSVRYRNERMFQTARTVGLLQLPNDGPTKMQRAAWVLLNVVLPYAWSSIRYRLTLWLGSVLRHRREHQRAVHRDADRNTNVDVAPTEVVVGKWIDFIEGAWGVASLINLMVFFQHGRYTTLIDRMLSMRQVPSRSGGTRQLNFDFQNRQIVFSELNNFALYILPMLRVYSTLRAGRRMGARLTGRMKRLGRHVGVLSPVTLLEEKDGKGSGGSGSSGSSGGSGGSGDEKQQQNETTPPGGKSRVENCTYCGESPASMPYVTSCGCTMCFYCLRTHVDPVERNDGKVETSCPSCGQRMTWSRRWEEMFGPVDGAIFEDDEKESSVE